MNQLIYLYLSSYLSALMVNLYVSKFEYFRCFISLPTSDNCLELILKLSLLRSDYFDPFVYLNTYPIFCFILIYCCYISCNCFGGFL